MMLLIKRITAVAHNNALQIYFFNYVFTGNAGKNVLMGLVTPPSYKVRRDVQRHWQYRQQESEFLMWQETKTKTTNR